MRLLFLKTILRFFSLFSFRINQIIGALLGRLIWYFSKELKNSTLKNLKLAYKNKLTNPKLDKLGYYATLEFGKTITEVGIIFFWKLARLKKLILKIEQEQILEQALAKKRGVILIVPHLGSWEFLGAVYIASKTKVTFLYRQLDFKWLENFIINKRTRHGIKLAPTNPKGIRKIFTALKNNEVVGILPDQEAETNGGIFVKFFATPALTVTLPAKLAIKSGAQVVFAYAKREPNGYVIKLSELKAINNTKDIEKWTELMNSQIANMINETKAQYQWSYKKYRTLPDGTRRKY